MLHSRLKSRILIGLILLGIIFQLLWFFSARVKNHTDDYYILQEHIETLNQQIGNERMESPAKMEEDTPKITNSETLQTLVMLKKSTTRAREETDHLDGRLQRISNYTTRVQLEIFENIGSIQRFAERKKRLQEVCSTEKVPGLVRRVMIHKSGIINCVVPKAGCTFWKRVFIVLTYQDNITKDALTGISREIAHFPNKETTKLNFSIEHSPFFYPTRFIVTRDPYSRLLSSYLDKIYLPDFWQTEAVRMIRRRPTSLPTKAERDFLRDHFDQMAVIFQKRKNSTKKSTAIESKCGKYVTFSEFVSDGFDQDEPHWMPIHQICNPCEFNVTHIIRMETFDDDARVVLRQLKQGNLINEFKRNSQVDEEILDISGYNFEHFFKFPMSKFYKFCITPKEIAYRLWQNFRWRGYIDPDAEYRIPKFNKKKIVKEDFMNQIWKARKSGLQNPLRMKKAKEDFKNKAFRTISKSMLAMLRKKYALDFKLFGYTEDIDNIYSANISH